MKRLNNKGFGAIETVLILVLVAIVAGTGWYIWHSKQNTDKSFNNTGNSQVAKTTTKKPAASNYLTIKEWGIKIKLSATDSGAYYKVNPNVTTKNPDGSPQNLEVYSTESDALKGSAGISCKGEYIAYLLRTPADDAGWKQTGDLSYEVFGTPILIGNYKYGVTTHKQYGPDCFQSSDSKQGDYQVDNDTGNKFQAIADRFAQDFKSISAQ